MWLVNVSLTRGIQKNHSRLPPNNSPKHPNGKKTVGFALGHCFLLKKKEDIRWTSGGGVRISRPRKVAGEKAAKDAAAAQIEKARPLDESHLQTLSLRLGRDWGFIQLVMLVMLVLVVVMLVVVVVLLMPVVVHRFFRWCLAILLAMFTSLCGIG